jgi:predicted metal-binding membrane protein
MPGGSAPEWASGSAVLAGRDRATIVMCAVLIAITAVAWAQVVSSAMTPDPMRGMAMAPTVRDGLAYVVGWTVMMAAMMLPSALPMIALYGATQRNAEEPIRRILRVALFTLVYLGVWAVTGVPMGCRRQRRLGLGTASPRCSSSPGSSSSHRSSRCVFGTAAAPSDSFSATGAPDGVAVWRLAGRTRSIVSGAAGL